MELDSVRGLKAFLQQTVITPLASPPIVKSFVLEAGPTSELPATPPTIALGVAGKPDQKKGTFLLAVRIQTRELENSPQVESIRQQARGEVDIQYIGLPTKREGLSWPRGRSRPLKIGASIGHHSVTAGTLGAFVRSRDDGKVLILSNNHVLANENIGKEKDPILQPGTWDGGVNPGDKVGELLRWVKLRREGANLVDGALATIGPGLEYDARALTGIGDLAGLGDAILAKDGLVSKVGRTTDKTSGRVTAFELDNVVVQFGIGPIRFDGQIEIEGADDAPFSQGGDSGSLIVDADRRAVGLLFAGNDHGGANGKGRTYANPLRAVLDALEVDLVLA